MECTRCRSAHELVDVLHNGQPTAYCRGCIEVISKRQYAETLVIFGTDRVLKGDIPVS